jgi:hypothetical protein
MNLNIRYLFTGDSDSDGDNIINTLKTYSNNLSSTLQNGGKNIIKGIRYENVSANNSESSSEMYGGKKNKPSQGNLLHQEAVDYLKNDLNLSPLEARAYKAMAYRHIKEKYPDATNLERSKLLLSLVKSENFLDEYKEKLDSTIKILESIDSEKINENK